MDEPAADEHELNASCRDGWGDMMASASMASCQMRRASGSPASARRATSSASPTSPVASVTHSGVLIN